MAAAGAAGAGEERFVTGAYFDPAAADGASTALLETPVPGERPDALRYDFGRNFTVIFVRGWSGQQGDYGICRRSGFYTNCLQELQNRGATVWALHGQNAFRPLSILVQLTMAAATEWLPDKPVLIVAHSDGVPGALHAVARDTCRGVGRVVSFLAMDGVPQWQRYIPRAEELAASLPNLRRVWVVQGQYDQAPYLRSLSALSTKPTFVDANCNHRFDTAPHIITQIAVSLFDTVNQSPSAHTPDPPVQHSLVQARFPSCDPTVVDDVLSKLGDAERAVEKLRTLGFQEAPKHHADPSVVKHSSHTDLPSGPSDTHATSRHSGSSRSSTKGHRGSHSQHRQVHWDAHSTDMQVKIRHQHSHSSSTVTPPAPFQVEGPHTATAIERMQEKYKRHRRRTEEPGPQRHFTNPYLGNDVGEGDKPVDCAEMWKRAVGLLDSIASEVPTEGDSVGMPVSDGGHQPLWNVHSGVGGVALAELRAYDTAVRAARRENGTSTLALKSELRIECQELRRQLSDHPMELEDFEGWERVGRGSFGQVYKCRCASVDDDVAVKELLTPPNGEETLVTLRDQVRFLREIHNLGRLRRRQILAFYGWCELPPAEPGGVGRLYLVTEYCGGGVLEAVMRQDMPVDQRARLVLDCGITVGQALAYIHQSGKVHMDVAARNVLIDDTGSFKLGDAGLLTKEGERSPVIPFAWSPPEVANARPEERVATIAHDIWAFGVLLCEVVAAGLPYPGSVQGHALRAMTVLRSFGHPPQPASVGLSDVLRLVWHNVVLKSWLREPPSRLPIREAVAKMQDIRRSQSSLPPGLSWAEVSSTRSTEAREPREYTYGTAFSPATLSHDDSQETQDVHYTYTDTHTPSSPPLEDEDLDRAARAHLSRARRLAERCVVAARREEEERRGAPVSFLHGPPGVLAIAAAAAERQGDIEAGEAHVQELLRWADRAVKLPGSADRASDRPADRA
eukprot:Hpha_TRINITY_DN14982_c2_g1::TRINITY_DN14982_c2_g1_i1::g.143335::m.143335